LNPASTRTFDTTRINALDAIATTGPSHPASSPELTNGSLSVNDTRHSPAFLQSKTHNSKLLTRHYDHAKQQAVKQYEMPDKLVLEYKGNTVLIVESSVKDLSHDMELKSESVLLPVSQKVTSLDLQHAAATKIQASWRGYSERKLNPPTSARAMLLIMSLSMKFQQKCNGSVDRKLRGLKHRVLQEARFRVRSERQLQKLGEVNRKERDELCRLLDNENITLEAQDKLMRESAEKVDVTYHQLQAERHERENLERVMQLAAKEISAQAEREMQRSKEMDAIQRKVEKLANELKFLKLEQSSTHQRPRRSISPTPSLRSPSQATNAQCSPSPDHRPSYRHRMRPSAVPRLETGLSSSNVNSALYQKMQAAKDTLSSSHPKTNNILHRGKSLIPTNSNNTSTQERRR
jgi:IQ calmodulin-binding motif